MGEISRGRGRMRPQRRGRKGTAASSVGWAMLAGHPGPKASPDRFLISNPPQCCWMSDGQEAGAVRHCAGLEQEEALDHAGPLVRAPPSVALPRPYRSPTAAATTVSAWPRSGLPAARELSHL